MTNILIALLFAILPPCATEDSNWCSYDASTQGNGEGTSFVTILDTPHYIR